MTSALDDWFGRKEEPPYPPPGTYVHHPERQEQPMLDQDETTVLTPIGNGLNMQQQTRAEAIRAAASALPDAEPEDMIRLADWIISGELPDVANRSR